MAATIEELKEMIRGIDNMNEGLKRFLKKYITDNSISNLNGIWYDYVFDGRSKYVRDSNGEILYCIYLSFNDGNVFYSWDEFSSDWNENSSGKYYQGTEDECRKIVGDLKLSIVKKLIDKGRKLKIRKVIFNDLSEFVSERSSNGGCYGFWTKYTRLEDSNNFEVSYGTTSDFDFCSACGSFGDGNSCCNGEYGRVSEEELIESIENFEEDEDNYLEILIDGMEDSESISKETLIGMIKIKGSL